MDSQKEHQLLRWIAGSASQLSVLVLAAGIIVATAGAQEVLSQSRLPKPAPIIPLASDVNTMTSISVSKQFVVHGSNLPLRSAFSKFAESVKGDFLDLLYSTGRGSHPERLDRWKNQIVIQIRDEAADPLLGSVTTRIRQVVPEGFRIELTARIGTALDRDELRNELIRVLLAESILRDHKSIRTGGRTELLPNWLMAGVTEILQQKVHGRPSDLYEKVFSTGSVLSVDEILTTNPDGLDSLSAKMFELSSAGLIQTLLGQAAGANRMRTFISELAVFTGTQRDLLIKHFPGLRASRNSLEKWWALQMATMSQPGVFEWMSAEETEMALNDGLIVEFQVPVDSQRNGAKEPSATKTKRSIGDRVRRLFGGGASARASVDSEAVTDASESGLEETKAVEMRTISCRIEDVALYIGQENLETILSKEQGDLVRIGTRAHPLYRTVIQDYQILIGNLNSKTDVPAAEAEFAELVARRTTIQRQAEAIEDHLNWFEATQMKDTSGKFEGFFQAQDRMDKDVRSKRSDPISQYLDALEPEFRR